MGLELGPAEGRHQPHQAPEGEGQVQAQGGASQAHHPSQSYCLKIFIQTKNIALFLRLCGGAGTDSTVPNNTVQVLITTGTVTDSGSECTGFIG